MEIDLNDIQSGRGVCHPVKDFARRRRHPQVWSRASSKDGNPAPALVFSSSTGAGFLPSDQSLGKNALDERETGQPGN